MYATITVSQRMNVDKAESGYRTAHDRRLSLCALKEHTKAFQHGGDVIGWWRYIMHNILIAYSFSYEDGRLAQAEMGERSAPAQYLALRSEEHTSELQSLLRIAYAVFCLN